MTHSAFMAVEGDTVVALYRALCLDRRGDHLDQEEALAAAGLGR